MKTKDPLVYRTITGRLIPLSKLTKSERDFRELGAAEILCVIGMDALRRLVERGVYQNPSERQIASVRPDLVKTSKPAWGSTRARRVAAGLP